MDPAPSAPAVTPRTTRDRARAPVRPARGHGRARASRRRLTAWRSSKTPARPTAPPTRAAPSARSASPPRSASIPARTSARSATAARSRPTTPAAAETRPPVPQPRAGGQVHARVVGYCDRLHNLQAALLLVKLAAPAPPGTRPGARAAGALRFAMLTGRRGVTRPGAGRRRRARLPPLRRDGDEQGRGAASGWESSASSPGSTTRCRCTCSRPTRAGHSMGRLPGRRAAGGAHPVAAHVPGDRSGTAGLRRRGLDHGTLVTGRRR